MSFKNKDQYHKALDFKQLIVRIAVKISYSLILFLVWGSCSVVVGLLLTIAKASFSVPHECLRNLCLVCICYKLSGVCNLCGVFPLLF